MLKKKVLDARIGDKFREALRTARDASELAEPIPSLQWGRASGERRDHLFFGFYNRPDLPVQDPIRIVEIEEVEFVIIQEWLCLELEGKCVEIVDGELVILN